MAGEPRHIAALVSSGYCYVLMQGSAGIRFVDLWVFFCIQFLAYLSLFSMISGYKEPCDQGTQS